MLAGALATVVALAKVVMLRAGLDAPELQSGTGYLRLVEALDRWYWMLGGGALVLGLGIGAARGQKSLTPR